MFAHVATAHVGREFYWRTMMNHLIRKTEKLVKTKPRGEHLARSLTQALNSFWAGEDSHYSTVHAQAMIDAYLVVIGGATVAQNEEYEHACEGELLDMIDELTDEWQRSIMLESNPDRLRLMDAILKELREWHPGANARMAERDGEWLKRIR